MGRIWNAMAGPASAGLSAVQRLVLMACASHADKDGGAVRPSQGRLAQETGLSPRAVRYALQTLRKAKWLTRVGGTARGVICYKLMVPETVTGSDTAPHAAPPGMACLPPRHHMPTIQSLNSVNEPLSPKTPKSSESRAGAGRVPRGPTGERGSSVRKATAASSLPTPPKQRLRRPDAQGFAGQRGQHPPSRSASEDKADNGQRPTAPTPDLTQIGLFGRPAEDLKAILARLAQDDGEEVLDLARSAMSVHGTRTVGVWLRQVASWPLGRWRQIKSPAAYLGAALERVAAEVAVQEARERQRLADEEFRHVQRDREEAQRAGELEKHAAERAELHRLFESLSPGEREQIIVEATGRLRPVMRQIVKAEEPLVGFLGHEVRQVLRERRKGLTAEAAETAEDRTKEAG